MLLNKKAIKEYYHSHGKRVSADAWASLDYKIKVLLDKTIKASNNAKTIEPRDINLLDIRYNI